MQRLALLALGLLAAVAAHAGDSGIPGVSLDGQWKQGELLFGQAPTGSKVWFNGRLLRLTTDGRFVFGLNRDEPEQAELQVQLPDEPAALSVKQRVAKREYDVQNIKGLPPKMVTPPASVTARIEKDQALAAAARKRDSDLEGFAEKFIWPCVGRISGVYGSQRILNGVAKQPHYGVDVAVPTGTPVYAPASGVVSLAEKDMYYTGGTLTIDHGHGVASTFLHLSKLNVKLGQAVKQGELIAAAGATGRATGPHLDWRMSWFDARIDAQRLAPAMPPSGKR